MTHRIPIAAATVSAVAFALLASVASLVVPRTAAAQATAAARASRPARDAAVMSRRTAPPALVVSGAWLAARLGRDTSLVLVHVGATRGEYDAGHIAGSRWLALDDYAPANRADTLDRELPAPEALRALLEPLGVADGRHIVVIGQPLPAARFAFTMAAMGREAMVSVLDGGVDAWREQGRTLVTATEPALEASRRGTLTLTLAPVPSLVASTAEVAGIVGDTVRGGVVRGGAARPVLVDARAPEFYAGTTPAGLPRPGHIPGARNVPLPSLSGAAGTLRDTAAIRARFRAAGIAPRDPVITYCFVGMQASLLWLQARRLGHPARLYDASFTTWSRTVGLPVATGVGPR